MKFENLLEASTSSLKKLGKSSIVDIASEYPDDLFRILVEEFRKQGFKVEGKSAIRNINKIRSELKGSSLSRRNLWFDDRNNGFNFELKDLNTREELDMGLVIKGNKLLFSMKSPSQSVTFDNSIGVSIRGRTANEVIKELVEKIMSVWTAGDMSKIWSDEEERKKILKAAKALKKKETSMSKSIKIITKAFGLESGVDLRETGNHYWIRPSRFGIFLSEDTIEFLTDSKIFNEFSREESNFNYKFQFTALRKSLTRIYKKIENIKFIATGGFAASNEYFWFELEDGPGHRQAASSNSDLTYQKLHDQNKSFFDRMIDNLEDKAEDKTKSEIKIDLIKKILDKEEK